MTRSDLTILRSLDAAGRQLDTGQRQRAADLLEKILATPPRGPAAGLPAPGRFPWRRAAAAALAGAVLAAGLAVLPAIGGPGIAYASWTPAPAAVTARSLAAVTRACRDALKPYTRGGGGAPGFSARHIPVSIAERRGDYVLVLFSQPSPSVSAGCLARNSAGTGAVSGIQTAVGSSSGPSPVPPAGRILESDVTQLGNPPFSLADGTVGAGVTGVSIHAGRLTVTATVSRGRYVAWWPGRAFAPGPLPPSGRGGPREIISYDIHLANGQIRTHVRPA